MPLLAATSRADVLSDWNTTAADIVLAAKLPAPAAYRAMAILQTAVLEAVEAVHQAPRPASTAPAGSAEPALDSAVAAANRALLLQLAPTQKDAVERAFATALAAVPDGPSKLAGSALGERAAARVLAARAEDGALAAESYRPAAAPGAYVPTTLPVFPQWASRKPWNLQRADQFRPEPPPALEGTIFARDLNEVRSLGARDSSARTAEQTQIARFWEATAPSVYFSLVQSLTRQPGREALQNARLFAQVAQAMDDALIATFDAKYHYGFWRPLTAIRNADRDGNEATELESGWLPFIDTPMHPEYPAAHCALAAAVSAVLEDELSGAPTPRLSASSPTAPSVVRSWDSLEDFVREVGEARIFDGVHFRNSTQVGAALGARVGRWTLSSFRPKAQALSQR